MKQEVVNFMKSGFETQLIMSIVPVSNYDIRNIFNEKQ